MEVILQQDFPALGYVGDKIKVRPGYGRNFLIPRGIALEASGLNERMLTHKLTSINAKRVKLRAEAEQYAKRLESLKLEFTIKVGASGRSFGAISVRDVEAQLKEKGVELDRRQLRLNDTIKRAGEFSVSIRLHSEVSATVPLVVRSDAPVAPPAEAGKDRAASEGKGEGRSRRSRKKSTEENTAEDSTSSDESVQAGDPASSVEEDA